MKPSFEKALLRARFPLFKSLTPQSRFPQPPLFNYQLAGIRMTRYNSNTISESSEKRA